MPVFLLHKAFDIQADLLTVWMCYFHDLSVTDKSAQWFVGIGFPSPPNCCQGAISLRPMPSPPLVTEHYPPPHSFLVFICFFFLSLYSTPPLSVSCVKISPTPLLCHQLAPSVSKSWSHCACVALFLFSFLITHVQYACTAVAFHKHIHWTNTGHAYLHCYYQPLTSPGSLS